MADNNTLTATQLLRQRHQDIENLFEKALAAPCEQRSEVFDCLRATLAVHETTEEMFVHPLGRLRGGDEGNRIVEARLTEEQEAKNMLADLEKLGPDGDQFATRLTMFQRAVLDHAGHEERELFPLLDRECSQEELSNLADAIIQGEQLSPTHPHPHAGENPVVLMLAGPFVAMVDKARDHFKSWTQSRGAQTT